MLNRTILIGRLTRDPELRQAGETPVTKFGLAVDRPKRKDGTKDTDFPEIVAWGKLAEVVAANLTKGRLVAVEGRLTTRSYEKDGQKRTAVEVTADQVHFLDQPKPAAAPVEDINLEDEVL